MRGELLPGKNEVNVIAYSFCKEKVLAVKIEIVEEQQARKTFFFIYKA